jgi:hypothetical protein
MGFGRRLLRKTVRKATPRTVRRAMHPARSLKYAATPRVVKRASRTVYTITNPLAAAENKLIGAALSPGSRHRGSGSRSSSSRTLNVPAGQNVTGSGVRAEEAADSERRLAWLFAAQRQRFSAAERPIVEDPIPVPASKFQQEEWARRKCEVSIWRRAHRKDLRTEVDHYSQACAAEQLILAQAEQHELQSQADTWWEALVHGQSEALTAALDAAFDDNFAPLIVIHAEGANAVLALGLQGPEVLPKKKAHVTPTGKLSARVWTKTELNQLYAEFIGAHLLATLRETWAIGPSLDVIRVVGIRKADVDDVEILFDIQASRRERNWAVDEGGDLTLERSEFGLYRVGKTQEVRAWPVEDLPTDTWSLLRQ